MILSKLFNCKRVLMMNRMDRLDRVDRLIKKGKSLKLVLMMKNN